jgi:hypothetical protein
VAYRKWFGDAGPSNEIRNSELSPEARERKRSEVTEIDGRVKPMMESLWGLEGKVYFVFG